MTDIWKPPPSPPLLVLAAHAVHIWRAWLDQSPAPYAPLLSADESERASRFHFERDRRRYTVGHGIVRQILSRYVGLPPAALTFQQEPYGKPSLTHSSLAFNLSHSQEVLLLAVSLTRMVGVDVEFMRPMRDLFGIARTAFSDVERRALVAVPEADRVTAFFQIWTRKEAFIKAVGKGLSYPLDAFDVNLGEPARILRIYDDDARNWSLYGFRVADEYMGAVVVAGGQPCELEFYHYGD